VANNSIFGLNRSSTEFTRVGPPVWHQLGSCRLGLAFLSMISPPTHTRAEAINQPESPRDPQILTHAAQPTPRVTKVQLVPRIQLANM